MTKKYNIFRIVFFICSLFCLTFPLTFYGIQAFIYGTKIEKFTLGAFCCVAIGMVVLNFLMKWKLRSMVWLIVLGIFVCLNEIQAMLIMMAVCTILDECLFTPLYKHFNLKYKTNKEIDKRVE
jgi:hypothetical protein